MLRAADLECVRGGRRLFGALSFELRGGELVRIAGANGSGKTSLLRILCGLLAPAHGEVRWLEEPIRALREEYSAQLVYCGHAPALKDELTPAENLETACRLSGTDASRPSIRDALARFGLANAEVPSRRLSQGQRRRAALARLALSGARPLWLLDEPLAALDAEAVALTETLIAEHVRAGGMAVYTTHQAAALDRAVTRVIDLDAPGAAR